MVYGYFKVKLLFFFIDSSRAYASKLIYTITRYLLIYYCTLYIILYYAILSKKQFKGITVFTQIN